MSRRPDRSRRTDEPGEALIWAPIAYLLAGLLCMLVFVAALPRADDAREAPLPVEANLRDRVDEPTSEPSLWSATLESICEDPALQSEGLAVDCETGTITFGDDLFDAASTVQLTEEGIRKLHLAIGSLLRSLRRHDAVWDRVEAIELRGHADPRALRDPYLTNMRISQERPMAIMYYLISDWGLSERDRRDLERLLILSAASHSRPPADCPEPTTECFPAWRRVEITPRLRVSEEADEMPRFRTGMESLLSEDS